MAQSRLTAGLGFLFVYVDSPWASAETSVGVFFHALVALYFTLSERKRTMSNLNAVVETITPIRAQEILEIANNNNRPLDRTQVTKLKKNILANGWLNDGCPLVFNEDGELLEGQHRLSALVELGNEGYELAPQMVVINGVADICFDKMHNAKPRSVVDVINRGRSFESRIRRDSVSMLNTYLKRELGRNLTNATAVEEFAIYERLLAPAVELAEPMTEVETWSTQQAEVRAFALHCIISGLENQCAEIVTGIADAINDSSTSQLFNGFVSYWGSDAVVHKSNEAKKKTVYEMLTYTLEQYMKKGDRVAFKYGR